MENLSKQNIDVSLLLNLKLMTEPLVTNMMDQYHILHLYRQGLRAKIPTQNIALSKNMIVCGLILN